MNHELWLSSAPGARTIRTYDPCYLVFINPDTDFLHCSTASRHFLIDIENVVHLELIAVLLITYRIAAPIPLHKSQAVLDYHAQNGQQLLSTDYAEALVLQIERPP